MARPCTGCGVKVDALGKLSVATSGSTWPFTTSGCSDASAGTGIYCAADGTVHGPPEKFVQEFYLQFALEQTQDPFTGQVDTIYPTPYDGRDIQLDLRTLVIENPSACRPAQLVIEQGVVHAKFEKVGPGESRMFVNPAITVVGNVDFPQVTQSVGPHQLWGHKGTVADIAIDSMGSWQRTKFSNGGDLKLAAGGTATIDLSLHMSVTAYNGNTTIRDLTVGVRVRLISL